MPWSSLNTVVIIDGLHHADPNVKQTRLADDASGGGKLFDRLNWYNNLMEMGKKFG